MMAGLAGTRVTSWPLSSRRLEVSGTLAGRRVVI